MPRKSLEIGLGGVQLAGSTYFTPTGVECSGPLYQRIWPSPIADSCFFYDSAYALAYNIEFLVKKGYNYEDPVEFMKALRNSKFRGCSGVVPSNPAPTTAHSLGTL